MADLGSEAEKFTSLFWPDDLAQPHFRLCTK